MKEKEGERARAEGAKVGHIAFLDTGISEIIGPWTRGVRYTQVIWVTHRPPPPSDPPRGSSAQQRCNHVILDGKRIITVI